MTMLVLASGNGEEGGSIGRDEREGKERNSVDGRTVVCRCCRIAATSVETLTGLGKEGEFEPF